MSGNDLPQLDTQHAHPARVYNYWLGGKDNFAADREAAEQAIAANPGIKTDVRANRAFLTRAVRYLAGECGVRQFLDIGTGLPVAGNTHQVAQEVAPDARIVYADNDRCKSGCTHAASGRSGCLKRHKSGAPERPLAAPQPGGSQTCETAALRAS